MINNYELQVRCIGLENNDIFPLENTGRGKDISPAFEFENLSPVAKTIAITLEEGWYNRKRIHSSIGYLTPQQKEDEELKKTA